MENRHSASITVEASYVMAMVLMALAVLIRTASGQCLYNTQVMRLHHVIEQLHYIEDDEQRTWFYGQAVKASNQIDGHIRTNSLEKEIQVKIHEPEETLRMLTIFEGE